MATETYKALAAPFETHHKRPDGLTYLSGEQIISRLNDVLGPGAWSFKVLEHGIHVEADEFWALGELTARIDGDVVVRQQFGSQKTKRSRESRTPLDIGFDLKGATTDALKKAATLIGVGLYLSSKEEHAPDVVIQDGPKPRTSTPAPRAPAPIAAMQQGVQNAPRNALEADMEAIAGGGPICPQHGTARLKPSTRDGGVYCSAKADGGGWCQYKSAAVAS
jgi:hypothetical protein